MVGQRVAYLGRAGPATDLLDVRQGGQHGALALVEHGDVEAEVAGVGHASAQARRPRRRPRPAP